MENCTQVCSHLVPVGVACPQCRSELIRFAKQGEPKGFDQLWDDAVREAKEKGPLLQGRS